MQVSTTTVEIDDRGFVNALKRLVEKFRADHGLPLDVCK